MIEIDNIYNMDCLEGMKQIADNSIDCIICDLPYGTTACAWDSIIPFDKLWTEYKRIRKPNAPILLFGSEPFSTMIRMSNLSEFRYDWIWQKNRAGNFQICKVQPLKLHEVISVFYAKMPTYKNTNLRPCHIKSGRKNKGSNICNIQSDSNYIQEWEGYNESILHFAAPTADRLHPTQSLLTSCVTLS